MKHSLLWIILAIFVVISSHAQTTYSRTFYVSGTNQSSYVKFEISTTTVDITATGNYSYQKINFEINCILKITMVNLPGQTSVFGNITFDSSKNATAVTTYFPSSGSISSTASPYTYTENISTTSSSTISAYYEDLSDKNLINNTSILPLAAFALAKINFTMANYTKANNYKGTYSFDNYDASTGENLISTSSYSLPFTLTNFTATSTSNSVQLNWSTSSEINNKYFVIQRSSDGSNYDSIGIVNGNVTTNTVENYSYTDYNYSTNTNYYRLKQVDYDGNFTISDIISINMNSYSNSDNSFGIYPNPGIGNIYFKGNYTDIKSCIIYNISGQLIETITPTSNKIQLRRGLPPGLYIIKIILRNNTPISLKYILK